MKSDPLEFQTRPEVDELLAAVKGNASELARLLGFPQRNGRQRIAKWKRNGRIPEVVVLAYRAKLRKLVLLHRMQNTSIVVPAGLAKAGDRLEVEWTGDPKTMGVKTSAKVVKA